MLELTRLFSLSGRAGHPVLIAFVDLDGLGHQRRYNGHEAGGRAARRHGAATEARPCAAAICWPALGGRVRGRGHGAFPGASDTLDGAVAAFRQRLFEHSVLSAGGDKVIHYPGASVGRWP